MSEFKLTTVEEFEEATARLLETGAKVGADAWQLRVKKQKKVFTNVGKRISIKGNYNIPNNNRLLQ